MRTAAITILVSFCACWVLLGLQSIAQTVTPENVILQGSEIAWDAPTKNVDGTPMTDLDRYDVALTQIGQQPDSAPLKVLPVPIPATEVSADSLLQGQSTGSYNVWCRAVDLSGNASTWAGPVEVYWDRVAPNPPLNLRIVVNVNVTVGGGNP